MAKRGEIRGKSIARRGEDIKKFRASLPRGNDPVKPWSFQQKEYTYSPNWRDVGSEQLRKQPDGDAKSAFIEARGDAGQMWRDATNLPVLREVKTGLKDIGSMFKFPGLMSLIPALGIGESIEQNEENERILGDAYTDEVRKEMMSPSDREYYEKYMKLGDMRSGKEADYYYDQARTALENAQVTRRVNYALGNLGFDTSADPAVGAWNAAEGRQETEAERLERSGMDYGALSGNLQRGLEGTKTGKSFIKKHAIPKKGDTPEILEAIRNYTIPLKPGTGQSRLDEDLNTIIPPESFAQGPTDEIITTVLPGLGYDQELPAYSDAPTSILEDYGESNVGLMGPGPLVGYTDRDLERDELLDELTSEINNPYTNYNPFRTPYTPMDSPPKKSFYDKYIDPLWNTGYDYYNQ